MFQESLFIPQYQHILKIFTGHRVVVRRDIQKVKDSGQVTVICGGGSGHEPFAAGFVGEGMLSAAVAGSVFASPPPTSILAAIKAVQSSGDNLAVSVVLPIHMLIVAFHSFVVR